MYTSVLHHLVLPPFADRRECPAMWTTSWDETREPEGQMNDYWFTEIYGRFDSLFSKNHGALDIST